MRILRFCFFLFPGLIFVPLVYGQGISTGDLHVMVVDPQRKPVASARVVASDVTNGIERVASGTGEGRYSLRGLPPGAYVVTVNAPQFVKATLSNVLVTVGGSIELPVMLLRHMPLTAEAERQILTGRPGAPDLVEATRTSTANTVNQREIDDLPINGRNYINFALTDSQVLRDNAPNTGAAPTSGLNINGQRARSNLVNVDGADSTDNGVNGVRSTVSQEDVQEFQVITNGYTPEYGRAAGGVVNIVTKSGANDFHGDVFGYLRNRNFQAVNPFSNVRNPAYTRVEAGAAFGGAIKPDKTFFFFSYEITRRHETGFSSIGADNFGLQPFDTSTVGLPYGTLELTQLQKEFLQNPKPTGVTAQQVQQYAAFVGASSGMALNRIWPSGLTPPNQKQTAGFPSSCASPPCYVPGSFQGLVSQEGNFPVFEGTSLYSLRLDHNLSTNQRLTLRANVSPSTTTGIEVSGQDQPFGQNAYSRTSEQTYHDLAGVVEDTWTISGNKLNQSTFQYARRGLAYIYNTSVPGGSDPAVNIPGVAYFGREPYSYLQRTEQRYQFTDNFSWTLGSHHTKFGADFNYIPAEARFTLNYGGIYSFSAVGASQVEAGFSGFPQLSPVQAYGAGIPANYIQGLGSPNGSFNNYPIGMYWQDSWHVRRNLSFNYGLRYEVEIPPKFPAPQGLAQTGYERLGLQKGIQTDTNNFQPRVGFAWDPKDDGKTVIRSSYGIFYDHPLLALYFLGNASDGSSSGQLAFAGTGGCVGAGNPANLNAVTLFQGLIPGKDGSVASPCSPTTNAGVLNMLNYSPGQQRFACNVSASCGFATNSNSVFLGQNYLTSNLPLAFQPFGLPQAKNFVYAYSQQVNFGIERDLGRGFALDLAYNFNGGRHLNRPINANPIRGDLMVRNLEGAQQAATDAGIKKGDPKYPTNPLTVGSSTAFAPCGVASGNKMYVPPALMNFFRPSGLNPSIAEAMLAGGGSTCVSLAEQMLAGLKGQGFNADCDPSSGSTADCIPFGDMDANYSNGSSVYHGFSANLRKRFSGHYEFLASYTWSHAIDDSTDLQSTLIPQDSYYPGLERSNSIFDQRHRFVFSGVYQTGKVGNGPSDWRSWTRTLLSDWTFAPLIEFGSGRPYNIITGNGDNLQLAASSLTGRPNTYINPACGNYVSSKFSPTGVLQEPCIESFTQKAGGVVPTLLQLDGTLGRNAGVTPWTVFNDLRVARKIPLGERMSLDASVDIFNIANRYNVAAVNPVFIDPGQATVSPVSTSLPQLIKTNLGQATAAYDPRQIQFGMKVNW